VIAFAQQVRIEAKATGQISPPNIAIQRLIMKPADKVAMGHIIRIKDTLFVSIPDKRPIKLPYRLQPVISYDGSTIIQFGDRKLLDMPNHLDVYWIDTDGIEKARLVNYYSGDARLNISSDGYTAIGGTLFDKSSEASISVYSPEGKKIWETGIAKDRRVTQLFAAKDGNIVCALTTDKHKKLDKYQLNIYDKSGKLQFTIQDLGIIQRIVLLGDETKLFFQGQRNYGMIDAVSGSVLWKNSGTITLVSPYGASLSPNGKNLYILVVPSGEKRTGSYKWKFMIIDASTGKEIGSQTLPHIYPATWERIFESVTDDSATVLAGESRITISVGSEKGGRQ